MADEQLFSNPEDERAYEEFVATQEPVENFELDTPALVCRWRMSKKQVPMLNRHIRALSQRRVMGEPLTANMLSWAKQHVEWSLAEGDFTCVDGVLMLVIDVNGNAAMTVGEYEPLQATDRAALLERAATARAEAETTGVAPELVAAVEGNRLVLAVPEGEHLCGTATLVEQLAQARGVQVERTSDPSALAGAAFLISDEHGVVAPSDSEASSEDTAFVSFLAEGYTKLLNQRRR